jgi:four helix bundle protein
MATHKELKIWQLGIDLVIDIYKITGDFPVEEKYGLTSQLRKSSVSIPSNIAEGAARKNDKEFLQFLFYSLGSISELETQLIISKRLGYPIPEGILNKVEELGKSINAFIKYLKNLQQNPRPQSKSRSQE